MNYLAVFILVVAVGLAVGRPEGDDPAAPAAPKAEVGDGGPCVVGTDTCKDKTQHCLKASEGADATATCTYGTAVAEAACKNDAWAHAGEKCNAKDKLTCTAGVCKKEENGGRGEVEPGKECKKEGKPEEKCKKEYECMEDDDKDKKWICGFSGTGTGVENADCPKVPLVADKKCSAGFTCTDKKCKKDGGNTQTTTPPSGVDRINVSTFLAFMTAVPIIIAASC